MSERGGQVYTIPTGVSFVDALARGLLARAKDAPEVLSRTRVLLPTRRACRALREAFLREAGGRALLLPRMVPLGDLDAEELALSADEELFAEADGAAVGADLPPAMPALRRQILLSRLILQQWTAQHGAGRAPAAQPREDQAVLLAAELARLLDQVETEGLSFAGLAGLVPEEHAEHWQITLRFLTILTEHWPRLQAGEGVIGPAERRRRLLEAQAAAWRARPPPDPVIVAGSTGSIPAAAELIATVADLPAGEVVLPGLDQEADEGVWAAAREEPSHPQHGLAVLLARLGLDPAGVRHWPWGPPGAEAAARGAVVSLALRPAAATDEWPRAARGLAESDVEAALAGVQRVDCPTPGEEATVIALVMREALETPGQRVALVTPDRALARRVAAELRRWDIEADDSAGVPLAETPPGSFLRLSAQMVAGELAPIDLLAALKHPLAAGGLAPGAFRGRVRELERAVLRGPRPAPGFDGLVAALRDAPAPRGLRGWLRGLAALARPFARALESKRPRLARVVDAHLAFAEALAANDAQDGATRLWAHEAGEAAAIFMAELRDSASFGPALGGERYPALLSALMAGHVVRPRYGRHPRLAILGPLEARLQHVDVMILGGLNEGTWPAEVDAGPWLSRPMRASFGLPPPERRVGLAAHDFAQAFAAPRVVLTRSTRVEGTPTVPSRWLLRLEALLAVLGRPEALRAGAHGPTADQLRAWTEALDRPDEVRPAPPPEPRPPVAARPRRLSVTQIETWMRDPYALYARHVLALRALDPIDAEPDAATRGTLIHAALEAYLRAHPDHPPDEPEAALIAAGEATFAPLRSRPGALAFWWPRFLRIARWMAAVERARRGKGLPAWAELRGEMVLDGPGGSFRLTATADRVERFPDGRLAITDYKTGVAPRSKDLELGFAPQLPLEAAIALAGGFAGLARAEVVELAVWRLSGGEPPGEITVIGADPATLAAAARTGLEGLVRRFDDPTTAYHAIPRPEHAPRFSDYDHLARIKEWSASAVGGEGAS